MTTIGWIPRQNILAWRTGEEEEKLEQAKQFSRVTMRAAPPDPWYKKLLRGMEAEYVPSWLSPQEQKELGVQWWQSPKVRQEAIIGLGTAFLPVPGLGLPTKALRQIAPASKALRYATAPAVFAEELPGKVAGAVGKTLGIGARESRLAPQRGAIGKAATEIPEKPFSQMTPEEQGKVIAARAMKEEPFAQPRPPESISEGIAPPEGIKPLAEGVTSPPPKAPPVAEMTPEDADEIIKTFSKAISSPKAAEAWEATKNLRSIVRAKRFGAFGSELEKLVAKGVDVDEAVKQAKPLLSGKYPMQGIGLGDSPEIRKALYTKLYQAKASMPEGEWLSTATALENALVQGNIPRDVGVKGGSAYTRLLKVFPKEIVEVLDKPSKLFENLPSSPMTQIDREALDALAQLPDIGKQLPMIPLSKRAKVLDALQKIGMNVIDVFGIPKTMKFMLDQSFMFRQLGKLGSGHPVSWGKTWKYYSKAMFSEKVALETDNMLRIDPERMEAITLLGLDRFLYDVKKTASYWGRPETMASKIAQKWIPGARMSERGAAVATNYMLTDVGKTLVTVLKKMKVGPDEYKAMGSLLGEIVGRGEMPKFLRGTAGDILNKIGTSPRFFVSNFEWPTKIFSSSKAVRQEAARDLIAWASFNSAALGMGKLMGFGIEGDPRSADNIKLKIGNKRIDLWAGWAQIIRLAAQLTTGERKTAEGKIVKISRKDVIDRYLQSKEAPGVGAILTLLSGTNYIGEKIDFTTASGIGKYAKETFLPAILEEIADAYALEGVPSAIASGALTYGGVGVSTYKPTTRRPTGNPFRRTPSAVGATNPFR